MKEDKNLTIVISTIIFSGYTGVELYVYELSKELASRGHRVIVIAPDPNADIVSRTEKNGVEVYSFESCPANLNPDILHLNEQLPSMFTLTRWPYVPAIATIHSQFSVEQPFISERIHNYICIRSEIMEYAKQQYPQIRDRLHLVYNGFDFKRFKQGAQNIDNLKDKKTILFVGTIDAIRKDSIEHLIKKCEDEGLKLRVVGKKYENYLDNPPSHVEVLAPRWEVEELFTSDVIATAGVLLGRSTIEGWIAGRPGWIYDIETNGDIKSFSLHDVPKDINKFDIKNVANSLIKLYEASISKSTEISELSGMNDLNSISSILTDRSVISGNAIHSLIKKADYLEAIISENCHQIELLNEKTVKLNEDIEKIRSKVHHVGRYSPKNIKRKLKTIALKTVNHDKGDGKN